MANGLSALLNLQKQPGSSGYIPQQTEEDYALDTMIPDEALYEAQDEIGRRGADSGRAYSVPSRESLRGSGRSGLRRIFGEIEAKGNAEARPRQIAGEYDLRRAQIEAQGAVAAAQAKAQTGADTSEMEFQRDLFKQDRQNQASDARAQAGRDAQDQRAAGAQAARRQQMDASALIAQAVQLEKQAQGAWDMFGLGGKQKLLAKAQELRAQARAQAAGSAESDEEEIDVTPEEWDEFQSWRQGGGR